MSCLPWHNISKIISLSLQVTHSHRCKIQYQPYALRSTKRKKSSQSKLYLRGELLKFIPKQNEKPSHSANTKSGTKNARYIEFNSLHARPKQSRACSTSFSARRRATVSPSESGENTTHTVPVCSTPPIFGPSLISRAGSGLSRSRNPIVARSQGCGFYSILIASWTPRMSVYLLRSARFHLALRD